MGISTRLVGMETYRCSKCEETKSVSEFHIQYRRERAEVHSQCKSCRAIYDKNRDKEKVHIKNVRYYKEHKEYLDSKSKFWHESHRERANEIARGVYARHIDRMREEHREHYRNNRDKWKTYFHHRRAREKDADGSFSEAEWISLLEKYNYTCLRCGKQNIPLTVDHVIPLSRGGSNYIDNIQPLCQSCNSSKFTKIVDYRVSYDYQ